MKLKSLEARSPILPVGKSYVILKCFFHNLFNFHDLVSLYVIIIVQFLKIVIISNCWIVLFFHNETLHKYALHGSPVMPVFIPIIECLFIIMT